jgi:cytochrome c oxidase accessory protein FixG
MSESPQILESPDEVLSTLHADGRRRWLYPVMSMGRYWKRRAVAGWALIALFVSLPLIQINGKPAVFLDIMSREFTFFGLTLYPTDTLLLALFGLTIGVSVFLVTALWGRVWCGWACPQTVYLEFLFRPIERLIEGKAPKRKRRDEGEHGFDWLWRKVLKWAIYTVLAVALAHVFISYFVGWENLSKWITSDSPTEHWGFFVTMAITSALILFDFGFFREQMCTITCPYARFQSVLQDRDSMIVSYDPNRGEPRGRRSREQRKAEKQGEQISLGDCIDCGACVRTCPTGIDIRNGLQMECVACTQCVDACDAIMDSIGKPQGLIRYASENEIEQKKTRKLRPRTIAYSVVMVGLVTAFVGVLSMRSPVDLNITRAVGAPFSTLPDGKISNRLRFRIQNRTGDAETYTIEGIEPAGTEIKVVGRPQIEVEAGATRRVEAWVVVPPDVFEAAKTSARFRVAGDDGHSAVQDFVLLGPNQ